MTPASWIDEIIHFWFEELQPADWFTRKVGVDRVIRERFLALYQSVSARPPEPSTGREALATVIVLDQLPRNLFRGSPQAYATDGQALAVAQRAIENGLDRELNGQQRTFLYMPFQHSEDAAVQARSVELFSALGDANTLDYARQHKDVIDRFARFPHRNALLGRASTAEEIEFMRTHPGF